MQFTIYSFVFYFTMKATFSLRSLFPYTLLSCVLDRVFKKYIKEDFDTYSNFKIKILPKLKYIFFNIF